MKMSPDILTFLLRGGHLNVEERKAKGLWPNETLRYSEVLSHLSAVVEQEEWFPRPLPEQKPGFPIIPLNSAPHPHFPQVSSTFAPAASARF
jgi:hypothetical protein